jgi:subtilisin family serine protease
VDVINLSVGSGFGRAGDPAAAAADNAAAAGIVVVAAAGNGGPASYLVSSPSTARGAISVASVDSLATLPGAAIAGSALPQVQGIDANESALAPAVSGTLRVLRAGPGAIGVGCADDEYAGVQPGDVVVTARGGCPRAVRAMKGQEAGAAAVIMVNNTPDLPPLEGPLAGVTIPFLGVGLDARPALLAADGTPVTVSAAGQIDNPGFRALAPESSGGPRSLDGAIKPDVAAPGVAIRSAAAGTGTAGVLMSGTSMAAPHVSGLAALVLEAHPEWPRASRPALVKAAIMNTADADVTGDPDPRLMGAGIVQARRAVDTVASATTGPLEASLSFGFAELDGAYSATRTITIANAGTAPIDYAMVPSFSSRLAATVTVSPTTVTVPPGGQAQVAVTLALGAPAVASLPDPAGPGSQVPAVAGAVTAVPTSAGPGVYPLRVPFLLVPRGLSGIAPVSRVDEVRGGRAITTLALANDGIHAGGADVFAWGLSDPADTPAGADVRAVGVASVPGTALGGAASDRGLLFAVSLNDRVSNAAELTVEIPVDTNGDGVPDFRVVGADSGLVLNGAPSGTFGAFTFAADGRLIDAHPADAPYDGSVMILPALASSLGLSPPDPKSGTGGGVIGYGATVASQGTPAPVVDAVAGQAAFDPFAPGVDQGPHVDVAAGAATTLQLGVDTAIPDAQRPLGWLLVAPDDASGPAQAMEVPLQAP